MSSFAASLSSVTAGNAPFCEHCGALLDLPDTNAITCGGCGAKYKYQDLKNLVVVTTSKPRPEPEWLKEYSGKRAHGQDKRDHATVEEECPKCKYHRMSYYTMQMRSVDEGQTVFYTCLRCSYKFSTNT